MDYSFYKDSIVLLQGAISEVLTKIEIIREYRKVHGYNDPINYITTRVKSEQSMKDKLKRKKIPVSLDNALTKIYDAAGVRIICSYINDVYHVAEMLKKCHGFEVVREKDYIKTPKPNGYRSYHIVFKLSLDVSGEIHPIFVEIQIRTIAQDFWSSLEHEIKYKKHIKNPELISQELKRCADQIATTDLNMQTIKNMISSNDN